MAIYDLWLSRNNGPTVSNYVGHAGRMFYDSDEKVLRVSDGVTPGGFPITPTTLVSTTEPTVAAEGQMWYNPNTFELWCYHDGNFEPTIDLATSTKIGGVKLGPGVTTNGDGQIIIDSTGLDFSFGDIASTTETYPADYYEAERQDQDYAVMSSINANEDIVLASNGTGAIRVVGDFSVRRANGNLVGALEEEAIFRVKSDGQVQMLVPSADSSEGAVTIVGGLDGMFQAPVNTGVMLHITGIAGSPGVPSRVYNDAQNSFGAFVTRRYNGTAAAPTAVLANEEIMRLSGTAHNGTIIPGTGNQRIVFTALGNQTLTNQGGAIELWATPINTTTLAKIATVNSTGITLESGKVFTGNVTGDVTGNVTGTAGSVAAANITGTTLASNVVTSSLTALGGMDNIKAGEVSIDPVSVGSGLQSTQTFTVTGLTTSHKIVVTPGAALAIGVVVVGAWVSATNTLSVSFQNWNNQATDLTAFNLRYIAWV